MKKVIFFLSEWLQFLNLSDPKTKNRKIRISDFSFVSEHCPPFVIKKNENGYFFLERGEGEGWWVCMSLTKKSPILQDSKEHVIHIIYSYNIYLSN